MKDNVIKVDFSKGKIKNTSGINIWSSIKNIFKNIFGSKNTIPPEKQKNATNKRKIINYSKYIS